MAYGTSTSRHVNLFRLRPPQKISIFVRDRQCSACLPGNGKLTVPLFLPGVGISNPSFTSTCIRRSESLWDFTAKSFREWHRGHVTGRVDHKGYGSSITCCHWKLEEDKTCVPLLKDGAEMIKILDLINRPLRVFPRWFCRRKCSLMTGGVVIKVYKSGLLAASW